MSPMFNEDTPADAHSEGEGDAQGLSSPLEILRGMLSLTEVAETGKGVRGMYRSIGAGTCGIVYEEPGTTRAIKLAKTNDGQLWNDYLTHTNIVEKFFESPITRDELQVPTCWWFADRTCDKWWNLNRERFPEQSRVVQQMDALCTERIPPLPRKLRRAIIDRWCPEHLKSEAKAEPANRDCLVRVYLGKRRLERSRPLTMFQLRNFNLHLDQIIQDLNVVEFEDIARTMGRALGVLHWSVGTDARDVEFVLGSMPTPTCVPLRYEDLVGKEQFSTFEQVTQHHLTRPVQLWLLDFNQCRAMTKDEAGVELAVQAFFINDPYYPRPLCNGIAEQNLWEAFKAGYMHTSDLALAEAEKHEKALPAMFLLACVTEQRRRLENQAEAAKRSASNDD